MYVGIDVSKEKFDACGIGDEGKKTDKKDALTIAQFVLLRKETLATGSPHLTELKDLSRRRGRLVDQMTSLKNDMKWILSVTFPEPETIAGMFTKSTLRLLTEFPSAPAIAKAVYDAVAISGESSG